MTWNSIKLFYKGRTVVYNPSMSTTTTTRSLESSLVFTSNVPVVPLSSPTLSKQNKVKGLDCRDHLISHEKIGLSSQVSRVPSLTITYGSPSLS